MDNHIYKAIMLLMQMNYSKKKFFGDQYFEAEEWFHKLPKDLLEALIFNQVTPIPVDQAWYFFRGYASKFQDAIGHIIVQTYFRDHPEYIEKLKKRNNGETPKPINKDQPPDMFR